MFYVPVIFNSLGKGKSASLLNTVIIGAVNVVSTFVSILSGGWVARGCGVVCMLCCAATLCCEPRAVG